MQLLRPAPDGGVQGRFDGVGLGQGVHPGRQKQIQLLQRELIEDAFQNVVDLLPAQLQAVGRHTGHVVALGNVRPDGLGPLRARVGRVEQHHKGFAQFLQFGDYPLLRLQIVLPGDVGDGPVGDHCDGDGGVVGDDLPGTDFRRLRHGNLVVKPGGGDHALGLPLHLAHGPLDHITHTVDKPHLEGRSPVH